MELKLVYRTLRQISDWALRYYSEVYVDGQENVPADGPLILCVYPPRMTSSTAILADLFCVYVSLIRRHVKLTSSSSC